MISKPYSYFMFIFISNILEDSKLGDNALLFVPSCSLCEIFFMMVGCERNLTCRETFIQFGNSIDNLYETL